VAPKQLSPADIAALKKAGFTAGQIQQISSGTANTALMNNAQKTLGTDPQSQFGKAEQTGALGTSPKTAGGWGTFFGALNPASNTTWADFYGFGNPVAKSAAANVDFAGGKRSVAPKSYVDSLPQQKSLATLPGHGMATTVPMSQQNQKLDMSKLIGADKPGPKGGGMDYNSFGGPFGTNLGSAANPFPKGYVPFTPDGAGEEKGFDYPTLDPIQTPVITPKDFTADATRIADSAFKPVLDSLAASKTNIGQQGQRARQVLSGLYSNMVNDIAKTAADSHAQYDAQKADVGQRGAALQQSIGQGYQSGQQNVAETAKKLGLDAAVPVNNQASANDQAWLQGMTGANTNAVQNYFGQQQQGEDNLNANRQDVARTSGTVAQENSLNQEGQAQQAVDQQIAGIQTDKANKAIDIGQNLTQQDLGVQTSNAGLSVQGQTAAQKAILDKWNAQQKYNQQEIDNQNTAAQIQLQKDAQTQKAAAAQAGGGLTQTDFSGPAKARAVAQAKYGADGDTIANNVQNVMSAGKGYSGNNFTQFMQEVQAATPNMDQNKVIDIALQYWNAMKGTGG